MKKLSISLVLLLYLFSNIFGFFSLSTVYAGHPGGAHWVNLATIITSDGKLFQDAQINDANWHFIEQTNEACPDEIKGLDYKPHAPQDADEEELPKDTNVDYIEKTPSSAGGCETKKRSPAVKLLDGSLAKNEYRWIDPFTIESVDSGKHFIFKLSEVSPGVARSYKRVGGETCTDTITLRGKPGDPQADLVVAVGTGFGDRVGVIPSSEQKSNRLGSEYDGYPFRSFLDYKETLVREGKDCWLSETVTVNIIDGDKGKPKPEEDKNGDGYPDQIPTQEQQEGVSGDELGGQLGTLDSGEACGGNGQACCTGDYKLPNPNVKFPNMAGLGKIINVVLSPIRKIVSTVWVALGKATVGVMRGMGIERHPCADNLKALNDAGSCTCVPEDTFSVARLCTFIKDAGEKKQCFDCNNHGVWTSIGCVDFKPEKFIGEKVFGLGVGFAGIFSLLCIIYSAFLLQISRGDPERIKKAREYITNCVLGLIMVIFSIIILRTIGVDILRIPGFK